MSTAGDVNGDGFDDVIIGAFSADEGGDGRGASYVVFGKAGGFGANVALSGLDGSNGFKLSGVADNDFAGLAVSANEGGTNRGATYVVFGKAGGFGASMSLSGLDDERGSS